MLAGRRGVTSTVASAPVLTLTAPPFPEAFTAYGMQTVHPYVGAVKTVALHIVD